MNEHEKLEEALDHLERYVQRRRVAEGDGDHICGTPVMFAGLDCAAIELLAECGRFRVFDRDVRGCIIGYWADEVPERKATP